MKRMNATIVRVRNSAGEFEGLPALQGISPYELAVENGFEGSEAEWVESMLGSGWIGVTQELQNGLDATNTTVAEMQETLATIEADAMPKAGGVFLGTTSAVINPDNSVEQLRNFVVVEAGTDLSTLSVSTGTIVMVKK